MPTRPPSKLLRAHDLLKPQLPAQDPAPPRPLTKGLSLRPHDAIDPYQHNRFAPEPVGLVNVTVGCPSCKAVLELTAIHMTERGLFIEGICKTCGSPAGGRPGIYKRCLLPLAWGRLPPVEED